MKAALEEGTGGPRTGETEKSHPKGPAVETTLRYHTGFDPSKMRLNAKGELCFPDAMGRLRRCKPDGTAITGRESADRVEVGDSAIDWYSLTP